MNNKKLLVLVFVVVALFLGTWAYTKAEGDQISMCVKKNGFVYVIGQDFRSEDCKKTDSLLSWNTSGQQGPKGDKGDTGLQGIQGEVGPVGPKGDRGSDGEQGIQGQTGLRGEKGDTGSVGPQGEPGLSAQQGAGNIAFLYQNYLLKTDGTVWFVSDQFTRVVNHQGQVPIPVSNIVSWTLWSFLDNDGNYWLVGQQGWHNYGPLP